MQDTKEDLVCATWRYYREYTFRAPGEDLDYSHWNPRGEDLGEAHPANEYGFEPAECAAYDYCDKAGIIARCESDGTLRDSLDSLIHSVEVRGCTVTIFRASELGCVTDLQASTLAGAIEEIRDNPDYHTCVSIIDAMDCVLDTVHVDCD